MEDPVTIAAEIHEVVDMGEVSDRTEKALGTVKKKLHPIGWRTTAIKPKKERTFCISEQGRI